MITLNHLVRRQSDVSACCISGHSALRPLQLQRTAAAFHNILHSPGCNCVAPKSGSPVHMQQARIAGLADHFSNAVVVGSSTEEGRHYPRIGRPGDRGILQKSSLNPGVSQLQRLHFRMS